MKNLQKITLLTLCIFCIAIFTSACGSSKNTPPDNSAYYYYLLANQNNNQQENNNNTEENNQQENNNNPEDNNQQENNQEENNQEENNQEENNQEENNQEENNQEETPTEITLTLTDSLNEDQIATADIYYKVEKTTKSSNNEDQEILKATPNTDDNTKFTITVNGTATNIKIKAILTYDSTGECLDYFSSYNGVEAQNDAFTINFENNTENDFEEGNGTEETPYIISNPRHFANINKKENNDYLYLNSHFQQSKDIDFTHLTGLKIVTDEDKNITIETINEKAPFYNQGHGIVPISSLENAFTGTYNGDNHIIDGIHIVNPKTNCIGLFTHLTNGTLQNITIGENSIFFIDENDEVYSNGFQIGTLSANIIDSTIENCTNNAQIIIKNIDIQNEQKTCYIGGITAQIKKKSNIKNSINNGNITIDNNSINNTIFVSGINVIFSGDTNNKPSAENCTNKGNINVSNNNIQLIFVYGMLGDYSGNGEYDTIDHLTNLKNTGNITINNNTTDEQGFIQVLDSVDDTENITNCTNEGNITTEGNSENFMIL